MLNEDVRQFNLSVGKKIKTRRLELKKTQSWLAKKIGVTFQQVQKYEKGSNGTNLFNLKQIADALKVSVLYFFVEEKPLLLTKEMEITNDQSASR
jgi:transcriptional regulator with XRE-family HTH domain